MKSFSASTIFHLNRLISAVFLWLKFEHFIQLNVTKNVFNKFQSMRSAVEQLVYWSTAVLHSRPPAQSWASRWENSGEAQLTFKKQILIIPFFMSS